MDEEGTKRIGRTHPFLLSYVDSFCFYTIGHVFVCLGTAPDHYWYTTPPAEHASVRVWVQSSGS